MLLALFDLFLTVLYARAGAGFVSDQVARVTWAAFRNISRVFGRKRATVLSVSGSFIVVALVGTWAMMLAVGAALIMHPYLGTSVRSSGGTNSGDFLTALYAGASSMSLVGSSNYSGETPAFRMVYLVNSLIGMSVMSLALTYVMQIYNALQKRNAFGLTLELMTRGTSDAAVLIGSLGPQGQFSAGYSNLATLADQMVFIRESHEFYPVLFYFRFPEARYSASRITLLALDSVSILRAALSDDSYSWLKNTASANQLWESSISLLKTLQHTFTPGNAPQELPQPNDRERERWGQRCVAAMHTLRTFGIETASSEEKAVDAYIRMRTCWNKYVVDLACYMQWPIEQIDCALFEVSALNRAAPRT
ncbi:MAG: two pore domain potassium channel family protein [Bryobacteraceae bacterium]